MTVQVAFLSLLALVGIGCVVSGVYLLFNLGAALIVLGVFLLLGMAFLGKGIDVNG